MSILNLSNLAKFLILTVPLTLVTACASPQWHLRPQVLSEQLPAGNLKSALASCEVTHLTPTDLSISHRGAPLGYPEHTKEGYVAAAEMGAGIIECDVTFTKDKQLVCRHSQCDVHSTTNILQTPLANSCRVPFTPADGESNAGAQCCTSDITLKEFKTLCGRRDLVNKQAASIDDYLTAPTNPWVDESVACGTLVTHEESIKLIDELGRDFTPELKAPMVKMPFDGMTQSEYASMLVAQYEANGINPNRVYPQSFNQQDVRYWITQHPEFADQVVYLDGRGRNPNFTPTLEDFQAIKAHGVKYLAPPIPTLLDFSQDPPAVSEYTKLAKQVGFKLIAWTLESNPVYIGMRDNPLPIVDMLVNEVGVVGIFSDWSATVTYYENCQTE